MNNYKRLNIIFGWITFVIASIVYLLTIEPTTSFWDCGEFISSAYKLEVGHPPGAPFFMIVGRFFTLFAGNDPTLVAKMVNALSALASGLTIAFLFWTITHLSKKIMSREDANETIQSIMIIGSGFVGALAYTFSDTFWFSAVEGEVYASSSLFTAVVFWAILKWENIADEKHANRWLILIAYLMGLSLGVHLLNLLAIPAIVMVYYFRKFKVTTKGIISALVISIVLLGFIMNIIIQGVVKIASWFELLFVNGFGAGFKTGVIVYVLILFGALIWGIYYTYKHKQVVLNTILAGIVVILIGYSSYAMIVIRSNANPPMDQNDPETLFSLLYYLNREQYGDRPLIRGQYYNAPIERTKEGKPTYTKMGDRYEITNYKPEYVFDNRFITIFPRMYSRESNHVEAYQQWAKIKGTPIQVRDERGESQTLNKPTFVENIRFFIRYQVGYMYWRYFMWNFGGRQNDIQGHGFNNNGSKDIFQGNWISGIDFLDEARLGTQEDLPDRFKNNKARNRYYLLPFLLGLLGASFHYMKQKKDFVVVLFLFILTGLAIVVYLNQTPYQPRERDYAYAGSFYAFAIWIGIGVLTVFDALTKILPKGISSGLSILLCLILVPGIMARENWDDHDRSGRYTARDFAYNYLNSCQPNAILFTNGDNDTFPLWYAQEVEGIRTDVRVVNLSYLGADWYIRQIHRKAYESDPLPLTFTEDKYRQGTRDIVYILDQPHLLLQEKYLDNKERFEPKYLDIINDLIELLGNSTFPELHPKDYETIQQRQNSMSVGNIISIAKKITEDERIEKYEINKMAAESLSMRVDDFSKELVNQPLPLSSAISFIDSEESWTKQIPGYTERIDFIPSRNLSIKIDKDEVLRKKVVPEDFSDRITNRMEWQLKGRYIAKNDMIVLDLLSTNNWERPIYFAITVSRENYLNLEKYFQIHGLAYKVVPVVSDVDNGQVTGIDVDIMFENMVNKFKWGNIEDPDVYLDENNLRMLSNFRNNFARLAEELYARNKIDSARIVLDRAMKVMPPETVPVNYFTLPIADVYYKIGEFEKANSLLDQLADITLKEINYFMSFDKKYEKSIEYDRMLGIHIIQEIMRMAGENGQEELVQDIEDKLTL